MYLNSNLTKLNFDFAAANYLNHAHIQKSAALKIIDSLPNYFKPGLMLDLGSGPGTLLHAPKAISYVPILYDLSMNMLKVGTKQAVNLGAINGTANDLPLADNSITTIISNLMMQWPSNKLGVLNEIKRVLTRNGNLIFTTLVNPSLWQLHQAGQNNTALTLNFLPISQYYLLCQQAELKVKKSLIWENTIYFKNIIELLHHFKLTGTALPKTSISPGLNGRKLIKQLEIGYCNFKTTLGIPLSYHYLMIIATKKLN